MESAKKDSRRRNPPSQELLAERRAWGAALNDALQKRGLSPQWLGKVVGYKVPDSLRQVINGHHGVSREIYGRIVSEIPEMASVKMPPMWREKQGPGAPGPHKPHEYPGNSVSDVIEAKPMPAHAPESEVDREVARIRAEAEAEIKTRIAEVRAREQARIAAEARAQEEEVRRTAEEAAKKEAAAPIAGMAVLEFDGDRLECIVADGEPWISLTSLCKPFGKRPRDEGRNNPWARMRMVRTLTPGGPQDVWAVHADDAAMLVGRMSPKGMGAEIREKHGRYCSACARVLAEFFGKVASGHIQIDEDRMRQLMREAVHEEFNARAQAERAGRMMLPALKGTLGVKAVAQKLGLSFPVTRQLLLRSGVADDLRYGSWNRLGSEFHGVFEEQWRTNKSGVDILHLFAVRLRGSPSSMDALFIDGKPGRGSVTSLKRQVSPFAITR